MISFHRYKVPILMIIKVLITLEYFLLPLKGLVGMFHQLQSIMRFRKLAIKQKTVLSNQLKGLLLEFNIRVSSRNGGLKGVIQSTLEGAENGLPFEFRAALKMAWAQYCSLLTSIDYYEETLAKISTKHTGCKRLLKLEGVSTTSMRLIYILRGVANQSY